jgi:uncharacterized caspase-like protein
MDRALLVGINAYAGAPLAGCVNDITDMAAWLTGPGGFAAESVRLLTDARATTAAIRERLQWLVEGLQTGDRAVLHYSGHGAQIAARGQQAEVGPLREVICPVDFDWGEEHMISDAEFHALFSQVPAGVEFVWIADACHSGDLERTMPRHSRPKRMLAPVDVAWRGTASLARQLAPLSFVHAASALHVALLAACKANQTAADAVFNGRPNGAFTYYLLQALRAPRGNAAPLTTLMGTTRAALRKAGYSQDPQLAGSPEIMKRAFASRGGTVAKAA